MSHESSPLISQRVAPTVFPQFFGVERQAPLSYGVVEISQHAITNTSEDTKPRQLGGIISSPVAVLVVLIIALVLIFGVLVMTPQEHQPVQNILQQSEPINGETNVNPSYKDITIPQGRLRGFTKKSREGRDYTAYYKVPYAEPPVGELRFKDPILPRSGWEGLRSIPEVAPQCIQKEKYAPTIRAVGQEDCLYANVYVPYTSQEEPVSLPVMVFIHGGEFVSGNGSSYGEEYFADEDVILITFQYRLGPLGFLSTDDDVIRGNMGLKDQVLMLEWTRDNAKYFGGDPSRVTIFGNSAGAISVGFLMLSPMARGLFHRAISQSGANACAASPGFRMLNQNPRETVEEVGRVLNCDTTNSTSFLECLWTKDAGEIVLIRDPPATYSITVENRTDDHVFMPDTPYNVLKSNPLEVPYIIGVVNAEWTRRGLNLVMDEKLTKNLNENFTGIGAEVLVLDMNEEELLSVKNFYFGDKEIGNSTFREAINLMSDKDLIHCSYVSAHMHSEHSPTYLYYLTKPPALSYVDKHIKGFPAKELGMVTHGDELEYFFLQDAYPEIPNGDPEYFEFSRYLVKEWATFAANGAPSSDWQAVSGETTDSTFWFELNDKPGRTEAIRDRMNFWDQFTHKQLGYE